MKAIINYFKQRRERKLRKWCLSQTSSNYLGIHPVEQAKEYYDWVTSEQFQS